MQVILLMCSCSAAVEQAEKGAWICPVVDIPAAVAVAATWHEHKSRSRRGLLYR